MLESLYYNFINDPMPYVMFTAAVVMMMYIFFRQIFERVLVSLMLEEEGETPDSTVDKFVTDISKRIEEAANSVKKRRKLFMLIAKLIQSNFIKRYLKKILLENPK